MKEFTIEQKAQRYDEAIERAKKHYEECKMRGNDWFVEDIEDMFPELKESEDERIRKTLVAFFTDWHKTRSHCWGISVPKILAWFEKQGEQKPLFEMKTPEEGLDIDSDTYNKIVDECVYGEQNPTDKVEPEFHEGEWLINLEHGNVVRVLDVLEDNYRLDYGGDTIGLLYTELVDNDYRLWTINDAKDGDILANKYGAIFINASSSKVGGTLDCYCYLSVQNKFCIEKHKTGSWFYKDEIKPATKEQCDLLFQKMKEEGYEWFSDKKELKKIELPTSWTEEDERLFQIVIDILDRENHSGSISHADLIACVRKLKSIRHQNTWKPSEEQMDMLEQWLKDNQYKGDARYCYPIFESLYQDLKKLKE